MFEIRDWTWKVMFPWKFKTFEDAEDFLCQFFDKENMDYEEWRGEYEIVKV